MTIEISLSPAQAKAVAAVAKFARLNKPDALKACAFAAISTEYDDRRSFREHVLETSDELNAGSVRIAHALHA